MTSDALDEFVRQLPSPMAQIHSAELDLSEPFIDLVGRFADEPGTVALLSGGALDSARFHILGLRPWLTWRRTRWQCRRGFRRHKRACRPGSVCGS